IGLPALSALPPNTDIGCDSCHDVRFDQLQIHQSVSLEAALHGRAAKNTLVWFCMSSGWKRVKPASRNSFSVRTGPMQVPSPGPPCASDCVMQWNRLNPTSKSCYLALWVRSGHARSRPWRSALAPKADIAGHTGHVRFGADLARGRLA